MGQARERGLLTVLERGTRDQVRWAAIYLAQNGGPPVVVDFPDSLRGWLALRSQLRQWAGFQNASKIDSLARGFSDWVSQQPPIYRIEDRRVMDSTLVAYLLSDSHGKILWALAELQLAGMSDMEGQPGEVAVGDVGDAEGQAVEPFTMGWLEDLQAAGLKGFRWLARQSPEKQQHLAMAFPLWSASSGGSEALSHFSSLVPGDLGHCLVSESRNERLWALEYLQQLGGPPAPPQLPVRRMDWLMMGGESAKWLLAQPASVETFVVAHFAQWVLWRPVKYPAEERSLLQCELRRWLLSDSVDESQMAVEYSMRFGDPGPWIPVWLISGTEAAKATWEWQRETTFGWLVASERDVQIRLARGFVDWALGQAP
jgi:hypothetical protein